MFKVRILIAGAVAAVIAGSSASVAIAQRAASPDPLASVQRGSWQLKSASGATRKICIKDMTRLIQIEHGNAQCQQFVIDRSENATTVRYSCTGHGNGRTSISVETPRLINIDTQGVANGAPFAENYEARFIGGC